jgi:hypothetical protein
LVEEENDEGEIRNKNSYLEYMDNGEVIEVQKKDDRKDDINNSFENECIIY